MYLIGDAPAPQHMYIYSDIYPSAMDLSHS